MPRAATAAAKAEPRVAPAEPRPAAAHGARGPGEGVAQRPARRRSGPAARPAAAVAATLGARALPLPRGSSCRGSPRADCSTRLLRGRVWIVLIGVAARGHRLLQRRRAAPQPRRSRATAPSAHRRCSAGERAPAAARPRGSARASASSGWPSARGFVLPVPYQVALPDRRTRRDAIRAAHRIVPPAPTVRAAAHAAGAADAAAAPVTTTMPPTGATTAPAAAAARSPAPPASGRTRPPLPGTTAATTPTTTPSHDGDAHRRADGRRRRA